MQSKKSASSSATVCSFLSRQNTIVCHFFAIRQMFPIFDQDSRHGCDGIYTSDWSYSALAQISEHVFLIVIDQCNALPLASQSRVYCIVKQL